MKSKSTNSQDPYNLYPYGRDAFGNRKKLRDHLSEQASKRYLEESKSWAPHGFDPETGLPMSKERADEILLQKKRKEEEAFAAKAEAERRYAPFGRRPDGSRISAGEHIAMLAEKEKSANKNNPPVKVIAENIESINPNTPILSSKKLSIKIIGKEELDLESFRENNAPKFNAFKFRPFNFKVTLKNPLRRLFRR